VHRYALLRRLAASIASGTASAQQTRGPTWAGTVSAALAAPTRRAWRARARRPVTPSPAAQAPSLIPQKSAWNQVARGLERCFHTAARLPASISALMERRLLLERAMLRVFHSKVPLLVQLALLLLRVPRGVGGGQVYCFRFSAWDYL
jgi:hypothetical protein